MDLVEIKKLIQRLGSAVIIDKDDSRLVFLAYERYLELLDQHSEEKIMLNRHPAAHDSANGSLFDPTASLPLSVQTEQAADQTLIEKLNRDIAILKEEIKRKELAELEEPAI